MVASPLLVLVLVVLALVGYGDVMMGFRVGLTTFLTSQAAIYAALVGLCYAGLCVCTTLIFLDRRGEYFLHADALRLQHAVRLHGGAPYWPTSSTRAHRARPS